MILPILLTTLLAGRLQAEGGSGAGFFRTGLLMTGISSMMTVLWGLLGYLYRKGYESRERKRKRREYLSYLQETEEYLQGLMERTGEPCFIMRPLEGNIWKMEVCLQVGAFMQNSTRF